MGEKDKADDKKKKGHEVLGKLTVTVIEAKGLKAMDSSGKSDPFATVNVKNANTARSTKTIEQTLEPVWNEQFTFDVVDESNDRLDVSLSDWDKIGSDDFLGQVSVPVVAVCHVPGGELDLWFDLLDKWAASKKQSKEERGKVHLKLKYLDKAGNPKVPLPEVVDKEALLRTQREAFQGQVDDMQETYEQELQEQRQHLEEQKAKIAEMEAAIAKEQAEAEKVRDSLASAVNAAEDQRRKAEEALANADAASSAAEEARAELERTSLAVSSLNEKLAAEAERVRKAEEEHAKLAAKREQEAEEKAEAEREAAEAKAAVEKMRRDAEEQEKRRADAEARAMAAEEELRKLRKLAEMGRLQTANKLSKDLFPTAKKFSVGSSLSTSIHEANSDKKFDDTKTLWSNRPVKKGEHVTLHFSSPVTSSPKVRAVTVKSGHKEGGKKVDIANGWIEVSRNGNDDWQRLKPLWQGSQAAVLPAMSVSGIRIHFGSNTPGWVLVQDFGVYDAPMKAVVPFCVDSTLPGRNLPAICDYKANTYFTSSRAPKAGDTITMANPMFMMKKPNTLSIQSGCPDGSMAIENAVMMTSMDAKSYTKRTDFISGVATARNFGNFLSVRIKFNKDMSHPVRINNLFMFETD